MDSKMRGNLSRVQQISSFHLLFAKSVWGEELHLYLLVAPTAVSAALVRVEDWIQHPIYYIVHVLCEAKTFYTRIEKLVLAIVLTMQKLRPYF